MVKQATILTSYIGTFIIIIFIKFVLMLFHIYQMRKWVELGMCMYVKIFNIYVSVPTNK